MTRQKSQKIKLESVKDKSTLVKLLAEEDVTVSYQKAQTASFNPNTREVIYLYGKINQNQLWI
tara:strand:- start:2790 stop:2978 length:189 start_codon:yes stop_codon:yes gene_type:complete